MVAATLGQGLANREVMIWQYVELSEPAAFILLAFLSVSTSRRLLLSMSASISANALSLLDKTVEIVE